ncbi:MAG: hypothetical protein FWD78_05860 [Treponema sp.]|nr:hypothetical protein [Treponema sp.]
MKHPKTSPIKWHTAFIEAIKLELEEYQNSLEFYPEFQLTAEPLRIDCVVVKKKADIKIKKNIASIFREVNLLEYKNPEDYISVNDFYKVYAYACLYASFEKVPVTNLTITLIENRRPRDLLAHLRDIRGYKVEKNNHGIYIINGDILPIQIINSRELSPEENLWLQGLRNKLNPAEVQHVLTEIFRQEKAVKFEAYLDAISRANYPAIEEAVKMSNTPKSFDEVLERAGLTAKWEARGEAKGEARGEARGEERNAIKVAKNMINLGLPLETVATATELDMERVKALYQNK